MRELLVRPEIQRFASFADFLAEYQIGENDLILTDSYIWRGHEGQAAQAAILFADQYGHGEPSDEMVEKILDAMPEGVKRVFGIGGGTVLDIAKLLSVHRAGSVSDLFDKKIPCVRDKELYLLPTTCGTGSEVTNLSILAFPSRNTKFGLADDTLYATSAILVPELLSELPFKPFAASAVDALVHALESWLSPKANVYTRLFSERAAELLISGFRYVEKNGPDSRKDLLEDFLLASNLAGIGFGNAGCGAVHALSYPLGGTYHVPHGESNRAMLMPVFYGYGMDATKALREWLAQRLDCTAEDALDVLSALIEALLPAKTMEEYGVKPEEIESFTDSVIASQQRLLKNAPIPMTRDVVLRIYQSAYSKK